VLATLHSSNVLDSLERLSACSRSPSARGLPASLPAIGGYPLPEAGSGGAGGRTLVCEHFENQAVTRKWISEGKFRELADFIGKGDNPTNVTFLQSLVGMIQADRITEATGLQTAPNPRNCSGGCAALIRPACRLEFLWKRTRHH